MKKTVLRSGIAVKKVNIRVLMLVLALVGTCASAGATVYKEIINIGSNICLPVRLSTSVGNITINTYHYVYDGTFSIYGAKDCSGRSIIVSKAGYDFKSGRSVTTTWNLSRLYDNGAYDDADTEVYDGGGYSSGYSSGESVGTTLGRGLGNLAGSFMSASGIAAEGYPYGALQVGISRFYGDFTRLSMTFGGMGGFHLFGGVGKEWIFKDSPNKEKLAWHVGMGAYFSWGDWDCSTQAVKIDVAIGETPLVINKALLVELTYEHFFGDAQRFGVFGGLGFSLGNFKAKEPEYDWDFQVGIAVKLWTL